MESVAHFVGKGGSEAEQVSDTRAARFDRNRARAKGSHARPVARFSSSRQMGWGW
jgi:hypothetical protein